MITMGVRSHLIAENDHWLFFVAYTLLIVGSFIGSMDIGFNGTNIVYLIVVAIALPRLFSIRASHIAFIIAIAACGALGACFLSARDPQVVVFAVLLLASTGIDFESIVRHSLRLAGTMLALSLLLALVGITPDTIVVRELHGRIVECHSLGFYHYSKVPTYWFFLYLSYAYITRKSYSFLRHSLWLIGGMLIYLVCFERLRFYLLIVAFVLFAISGLSRKKTVGRSLIAATTMMFPGLFCISYALAVFYSESNSAMSILNDLLSGRLRLENTALETFGITLFGQNVEMNNTVGLSDPMQYMFVDAAFIYVPIVYGIIVGAALLFFYTLLTRKAAQNNSPALLIALICIAVDCFVGNQLLSIWLCPLPFYLASAASTEEAGECAEGSSGTPGPEFSHYRRRRNGYVQS
ncbi:MAG TPA: hypothetical protein H9801_03690 [Candidatus Collinsella stercoripullorum]|nr:hypothetical protein [Candidatus Collinsella stercoripullorum]